MKKTLWLLVLQGKLSDRLFFLYAVDKIEAEEMAKKLEVEHGAKRQDLRNFPRGFLIVRSELPGIIEVDEER